MDIGRRMKETRLRLGVSQGELSRRAGVTQSLISQIERGENRSTTYISAIAQALGVSADWLATGRGDPRRVPVSPAGMAMHYPHRIVETVAVITAPEEAEQERWVVFRDEYGTQVTLRLTADALQALAEQLTRAK